MTHSRLKPVFNHWVRSATARAARTTIPQLSATALLAAIEQGLMRRPWCGYRRVTAQLQREGVQVGETGVRRWLKTLGHTCSVGSVGVQTTDSDHAYTR